MITDSKNAFVGLLICFNSKHDINGNRYWAWRYIDFATGKVVESMGESESNIRGIMYELNNKDWEPRNVLYVTKEMGKREFKRMTKSFTYAGCSASDMADFIRLSLMS